MEGHGVFFSWQTKENGKTTLAANTATSWFQNVSHA
jgi:hypothetical protein